MCGITGIFSHQPETLNRLAAMNRTIRHRGPDDEGYVLLGGDRPLIAGGADTPAASYTDRYPYTPAAPWDGGVPAGTACALGHRRLSILDLSPGGHQPLCSADGRYWITFNGEVYNYRELRRELEQLGHRFQSQTDTEVVLAAYAAWGADCLQRFKGMWAFAVVDLAEREVFVARDFFGIKPLYYAFLPDGIAIASEVKALLVLPQVSRAIQPDALLMYVQGSIADHGARTLLADVRQLPAAHYLRFPLDAPGRPDPARYWRIDLAHRSDLGFDAAVSRLQELFLDSVQLHLRSDVPVGAALSGGIDSSAVTMAARQHLGPGAELHTFSYIADDERISEAQWVDLVAAAAGTTSHRISPGSQDLVTDLKRLIEIQDLPFGSTTIFAQMRVFQLAHEAGIKVVLDGQGADEMLVGYTTYFPAKLYALVRRLHWQRARAFYAAAMAHPNQQRLRRQTVRRLLPPGLVQGLDRLRAPAGMPDWLDPAWFAEHDVTPLAWVEPRGREALRAELLHSLESSSLPALLRYEDRNSMAYSIESRVPFLEPELVSFLYSLPDDYLLSPAGETKHVFRQALRGLVPDPVLDRRDKIGFGTPERLWLEQLRPWVEGLLMGETARQIPALRPEAMLADWQQMLAGKQSFDWRFWRWLNLIVWTDLHGVTYA